MCPTLTHRRPYSSLRCPTGPSGINKQSVVFRKGNWPATSRVEQDGLADR